MKTQSTWSAEEINLLRQMKADGYTNKQIGIKLGRPTPTVSLRWRTLHETPEQRERRLALHSEAKKLCKRKQGIPSSTFKNHHVMTAARAPDHALAEREQRLAAPRTLSAMLLGDPPQGFSALDRKGPIHIDASQAQKRAKPTLAWQPITF